MARLRAVVVFALYLTGPTARAQELTPAITLVPSPFSRWDAAAHVIWVGERRPAESFQSWDRWLDAASGGGSLGYYWTSHLKTEFDLSTSSEGEIDSFESVPIAGLTTPVFVQREHEIRFTTASLGLTNQFFENAWFHPFVGAGVELVREREHIETLPSPVPPPRATGAAPIGPAPGNETRVRYRGRPYVATGFKVYLSDHAFIRTDLRTSWSADGLSSLGWRSGVGVDF
jgi:hypothetical protein